MQITGISMSEFEDIVRHVSNRVYEGNIRINDSLDFNGVRQPRIRVSLRCVEGKGEGTDSAIGARKSWSGRRMPVVCWHGFRDVLNVAFERYPNARVKTMHADYRGLSGFLDAYPETGEHNVGSMFQPAYLPELCNCPDEISEQLYSEPPQYIIVEQPI